MRSAPQKLVLDVSSGDTNYRIHLKGNCSVQAGQILNWNPREQRHQLNNPGKFDYESWLHTQNFSAGFSLNCDEVSLSPGQLPFYAAFFEKLSSKLSHTLLSSMPSGANGLLLAMLLGNDDYIEQDLAGEFRLTGLSHVLAISGFHIALFALIIHLLMTRLSPKRHWHYLATLLFLAIYGPLTGFPPSVLRAIVFYAIYGLSQAFQRKGTALNSLYLCAALMLIWDPKQIFDLGFQLSFLATFGLLYSPYPKDLAPSSPWSKALHTWIALPLWTTTKAIAITAPILAYHFHTLSPAGLIGNFFAVPLSTAFMISGAIGAAAPHNFTEPFVISAQFCYDLLRISMHWLAQIPGASIPFRLEHPMSVCAWLCAFLSLPLFRHLSFRILFYLSILTLFCFPLAQSVHAKQNPRMQIWFLDIGQGDATLVQSPQGHSILIDDGAKSPMTGKDQFAYVLLPFFKNQGISQLDALILTHADLDHIGSTLSLLQSVKVHAIYINSQDLNQPKEELSKVLTRAKELQIPVQALGAGQYFSADDFRIEILHPIRSDYKESNHASVVTKVIYGKSSALLTGDLEEEGESDLIAHSPPLELQSQILKIGHHGSRNGTSNELLAKVLPKLAVISCGDHNRYHHPHIEVLQRLQAFQIPYHITAEKGYLQLSASKENWYFNSQNQP